MLHLGYRSAWDIVFVFGVAIFFGYLVRRTRSIVGVTLSHGLINILLYLVLAGHGPDAHGAVGHADAAQFGQGAQVDHGLGRGQAHAVGSLRGLPVHHHCVQQAPGGGGHAHHRPGGPAA